MTKLSELGVSHWYRFSGLLFVNEVLLCVDDILLCTDEVFFLNVNKRRFESYSELVDNIYGYYPHFMTV